MKRTGDKGKSWVDVAVFDADEIHRLAFQSVVSECKRVRLVFPQPIGREAWTNLDSAVLVMLNMEIRECCPQLLLREVLGIVSEARVVCYAVKRRVCQKILRTHSNRIVMTTYNGAIGHLREYAGLSNGNGLDRNPCHLTEPLGAMADFDSMLGCLSPREIDVFCMMGQGQGAPEIAEAFGCSVSTVETHVRNLRGKLDIGSSMDLRRIAFEYILSGQCHSLMEGRHVCRKRNEPVGTCPFKGRPKSK